ncbi:MAG: PPC domain-containing DNA-binding protein [Bryobacteraceae bacterium]
MRSMFCFRLALLTLIPSALLAQVSLPKGFGLPVTSETASRMHVLRLTPGQDVLEEIARYAAAHSIRAGAIVSAVGSLKKASLRYANKDLVTALEGPFQVVALSGTLDRETRHLHLSIADSDGVTRGGHATRGNIVFTTLELVIVEFLDLEFTRAPEPLSGYDELAVKRRRIYRKLSQ